MKKAILYNVIGILAVLAIIIFKISTIWVIMGMLAFLIFIIFNPFRLSVEKIPEGCAEYEHQQTDYDNCFYHK